MGINPVQVEVGEFEEPVTEVEEVVAESKWLENKHTTASPAAPYLRAPSHVYMNTHIF